MSQSEQTQPPNGEVPRVTVCIPTYNRTGFLRQSIESVLAQTYAGFSLVVSDNASTDDTPDVVASYDDPRVTYSRSERNVGPVGNFNRCLDAISSEYGIILCDDDLLLPSHLEVMVNLLDEHPNVGLAYAACDLIGVDGSLLEADARWNDLSGDTIEAGAEFIRRGVAVAHSRMDMSTATFRRGAIPPGGFDPADKAVCDVGFSLRLALDWDVAFVDQTLGASRNHDDTFSLEHGALGNDHHTLEPEMIARIRDVKLALLSANGSRFADAERLRKQARDVARDDLLVRTWALTAPERPLGPTVRYLREAAGTDAAVALKPGFWRLIAASLLGPSTTDRLKHLVGRGQGASTQDDQVTR